MLLSQYIPRGWYNQVRKRSGHLSQGRFKSFLVEKDTHLAEVMRYVALNPPIEVACALHRPSLLTPPLLTPPSTSPRCPSPRQVAGRRWPKAG